MYYKYSVLSETGNEIKGIEEGSIAKIKQRLKEKNYYILSLEADIVKSITSLLGKKTLKAQSLAVFFEDLGNMLKTGIAINEAIIALEEASVEPVLTKALTSIAEDLGNGFSLAAAFERTKVFPWQVLSVLKVGEKSGDLERIFAGLNLYYFREADFMRSLKSAVIYPLVIFCMLIGVMFYVSFRVIPHLEALLPIKTNAYFSTRLLLFLCHFLKDFWFLCLLFPIGAALIYSKLEKGSTKRISSLYHKIPLLGPVVKDAALSSLFSNLSVLTRNGINIVDALSLVEETFHYQFLAERIRKLKDFISSGLSFWQAVEKDKFFPKSVFYSIRKGEEMGLLDEYLERLATVYFDRVSRRTRVILNFIQPALLIFCAVILLFIVSAFIIPVYSNLSNIAGGNINF
ncbi:MAG: type II secretion system F family protein [Candidatus Omnitrophica bacterium]|nr:type II secretion system F family protein [Candidatus Omnitrophota bacterium]